MDERHSRDGYFIVGEGLVGSTAPPRTGAVIFALNDGDQRPFRFSRVGPEGNQLGEPNRLKIAIRMTRLGDGQVNGGIPAGYTYLGQFLDHDLTFDKSKLAGGISLSPAQLEQSRSPSLDLDSLYGAGPADPKSAKFYEADGIHLKRGKTIFPTKVGFDLPRGAGTTVKQKRTAIIPDPRNDENLAVAQTHCAMIRFHNRVVDTLPASVPQAQRFATAREIVTKHYQWMIRTDYLPRICASGVVNNVFNNGRKVIEPGVSAMTVPTMPLEFSVAAFRLGHAMVRSRYNWNSAFDNGEGTLKLLFDFSGLGGNLGQNNRLLSVWIADFRRLYDFGEANKPGLKVPAAKFNRAMRIDTTIVDPLQHLPPKTIKLPASTPASDVRRNLAFRNLTRAKMLNLATGQQMANFIKNKGVNVTKLTKAQIRNGNNGADLGALTQAQRDAFLKNTPLWFYVLREAELNGGQLKGVGARIVAETFHRAMQGSASSIVNDTSFAPTLGPNSTTFRMVDLLLFAFEGKKALLAPNG
jgi:Animal haem peroxidase